MGNGFLHTHVIDLGESQRWWWMIRVVIELAESLSRSIICKMYRVRYNDTCINYSKRSEERNKIPFK